MEVEGKIEADVADKPPEDGTDPNVNDAVAEPQADERDYETEARALGWLGPDEFKGDPAKLIDAKTFVERGEVMLPLVKKQLASVKREFDEFKRQAKKALKFVGEAEERGYKRAMAELEERHAKLVDEGDVKGAQAAAKEMRDLAKPDVPAVDDDKPDAETMKAEFGQWVEDNDWYVTDANKRLFADTQAAQMGPAPDWPDGPKAWLAELTRRVERKFADKKPNPVNGGGNREKPGAGKTYADLPPEAKAMCDKWVKSGLLANREEYVKSYDFGA